MRNALLLILFFICCSATLYLNDKLVNIDNSGNLTTNGWVKTDSVCYKTCPARCSAYITSPAATTITEAGVYYFMQGTFANTLVASFTAPSDTLTYNNGNSRVLFITYSFSLASSEASTTACVAIYKNGSIIAASVCEEVMKTAGEEYHFSAPFLMTVNQGDKIKIMVKSDKASSTLTANHGSTVAFQIP